MSWKEEIKKNEDRNMMSARSDALDEDIKDAIEDLIDDLEKQLLRRKNVDTDDVIEVFAEHKIKLSTTDVLKFLGN